MLSRMRWWMPAVAALLVAGPVFTQPPDPKTPDPKPIEIPAPKLPPPPDRSAVAATVNGEKIPEIAVYRALVRVHPNFWDKARPEILSFLIENALVDQYLARLKITAEPQEIQQKMDQINEELKKEKQSLQDLLKKLYLTEDELREQIVGAVRWEKFLAKYATQDKLKDLFTKNTNMFDGSLVKAKHLLIKPAAATPEADKQAQAKAATLRAQIEAQAAAELAKLPAADKLTAEKARRAAIEKAFSAAAQKESDCPSKKQGGELGLFPRLGKMVEPFAAAAFALQPYQISQPVKTEFGYHLILVTETKPGREVKYEQVEPFVKEVYAERLREAILNQMRPISKIELQKAPAPN